MRDSFLGLCALGVPSVNQTRPFNQARQSESRDCWFGGGRGWSWTRDGESSGIDFCLLWATEGGGDGDKEVTVVVTAAVKEWRMEEELLWFAFSHFRDWSWLSGPTRYSTITLPSFFAASPPPYLSSLKTPPRQCIGANQCLVAHLAHFTALV